MDRTTFGQARRLLVAGTAAIVVMAQTGGVSLAAGGTGGNPFSLICPDHKTLVGIQGRSGSYVDSIRGVCSQFDELGNASAPVTTSTVGGSGGTSSFDLRCPSGEAMVGLKGRASWWVDRVQIVCNAIDGTGLAQGNGAADPFTAGGSGGDAFSLACPSIAGDTSAHHTMLGLSGRSGSWLDAITIVCGQSTIAQVSPVDPNRPDLRVAIRGLPFRVHDGATVEYTVTMQNVGKPIGAGAELDLATNFPINLPIIEVPFLQYGGCDVHNVPPPPVFVRCTAGGVSGDWGSQQLPVSVTFTADTTGTFDFSGTADPRNLIAEGIGGGDNNTRHETLRVSP